ncbi:thrombospondin-type laminin G domain and EAR repeat-containing protein-like isoform X2 [Ostrea edulis]|uniref:thrombospondin-type laminin G domain and EAR repeat-containing protein-like isoform X2 n=1 Tax=Ostrea edulis TaxID=37623 RepID=UPI0024AF6B18|nr:thrombospondin-type laminin G domain and EAR repeat-containing protein-like isoform X2 [Ostrea edulis]
MDPSVIFRKILIFMCLEFICDKVNGNTPDHSSCAGILPADLLGESIPKYGILPNGVSVLYDTNSHAHAYKFSRNTVDLQIPVSKIFKKCLYFPDEFSIFFVIKHERVYDKRECILHIGQSNSTLVSIQYSRKYIIFTYNNRKVQYRNFALKDKKWHSIGFSVSSSDITMTTDCINKRRKRLKRRWPSNLLLNNSTFQIASCAPGQGVTLGQIKDLIFIPGADAAVRACPPKTPQHRHLDNRLPALPDIYRIGSPGPRWDDCTWTDVGNIAYDLHAKSLKVCVNGIWQHVTVNIQAPSKDHKLPRRLDYIDYHQDIRTPGPSIDVEVFTIDGEGTFAVFASSRPRKSKKDTSIIYKWRKKKFIFYQRMETDAAQCWKFFTINNNFFLAVANYGKTPDVQANSTIFKWHKRRRKFKEFQIIPTWTARDFEHFVMNGVHYLAVANHAKGTSQKVDSEIYKWSTKLRRFELFQSILTTGAYDWTHFLVNGYHFLAVAQAFDGFSTLTDSSIFVLQDKKQMAPQISRSSRSATPCFLRWRMLTTTDLKTSTKSRNISRTPQYINWIKGEESLKHFKRLKRSVRWTGSS